MSLVYDNCNEIFSGKFFQLYSTAKVVYAVSVVSGICC